MDFILNQIAPHLSPDLQALILDPPSFSNPQSFLPLIRAALPYTKYLVVFVAIYVVWSFVSGLLGYFSRFMRFSMKIGPIIGLIGWLMAQSGHGGMEELIQAGKEWAGLAQPGAGGPRSPGIANLFGASQANTRKKGGGGLFGTDNVSGRTRSRRTTKGKDAGSAGDTAGDFINSMLDSATGAGQETDWQGMVQNYVKGAMAKAAGLDWLLGGGQEENAKRGKTR